MPSFCAVLDCNDKYGHGQNVTFHKFPMKNKDLLEKWIEFSQRSSDWRPSKWMSVCGLHFRDEDYRCLAQRKLLKKNAIPSIRTTEYSNLNRIVSGNKPINNLESDDESSTSEMDESTNKDDKRDSNCRFCGLTTSAFVSFADNFEIFGFIQKCLPTLSIRQDDNMPKEICTRCFKRLKIFASFIDKVLETQVALQRQYRSEKGSGTIKPNERILKIKQEPVVRVKQENLDDVNAFFPDEVYDGYGCGEQEQDASNAETQLDQKFQFCDFPVLNDQDIINNCDIMEIINLSDPFIDITNCENTIAEEASSQQQQRQQQQQQQYEDNTTHKQQTLPEILNTYYLNEEHNYANLAEDLKEEWPTRQCYKTEKIDAEEFKGNFIMDGVVLDDEEDPDINSSFADDESEVAATMTITTSDEREKIEFIPSDRSNKPIVTSVSSFNETHILPSITQSAQILDSNSIAVDCSQQISSRKKPNIVVLNESIVQSSHAIQFQACTICQSKFFSIDSLNHHYGVAHNLQITASEPRAMQPMVIVPSSNIISNFSSHQNYEFQYNNCYKSEKDYGVQEKQQMNNNSVCAPITDQPSSIQTPTIRSSKNEIKILDMQQTFSQHQYHYQDLNPNNIQSNIYCQMPPSNISEVQKNQQLDHSFPYDAEDQQQISTTIATKKKMPSIPKSENERICNSLSTLQYTNSSPPNTKSIITYETTSFDEACSTNNAAYFEKISNDYLELQKRYRRLKQKCLNLVHDTPRKKKQRNFLCRICKLEFVTIFQLIRHKQSKASHFIRKPKSHFFASCAGCEKFFCRKLALHNHMRYICQSLPLRWLKNQIRTFKCRYCKSIAFTHWRLCRKHEIKCRYRRKKPIKKALNYSKSTTYAACKDNVSKKVERNKKFTLRNSQSKNQKSKGPHRCDKCQKIYSTVSRLNQHRITHTTLRNYQCEICNRIFKRRHGLAQHIKGFHMKLKPYECPICKHCYALKGDMKRCKHSSLARKGIFSSEIKTLRH